MFVFCKSDLEFKLKTWVIYPILNPMVWYAWLQYLLALSKAENSGQAMVGIAR